MTNQSTTARAAKWLHSFGAEALAADRLSTVATTGEHPPRPVAGDELAFVFDGIDTPLVWERRAGALAARLDLPAGFAEARADVEAALGAPARAGRDPNDVPWAAFRTHNGVVLLAELDGVASLWLEPFSRTKLFDGIAPDVATWLAARTMATSRTDAEREQRRQLRRRTGAQRGGRLVDSAGTRTLARWFHTLAEVPLTRAGCEALAAEHKLVVNADTVNTGLSYLIPDIPSVLFCGRGDNLTINLVASEDGKKMREETFGRLYDAIRADVEAELGERAGEGSHQGRDFDRWSMFRAREALIFVIAGPDQIDYAERTVALRMIAWPADRPMPEIAGHPTDWLNAQAAANRAR